MSKKISETDRIRSENLVEEASEIMGECISCGICKSSCAVSRTLKEEAVSGRGQAILLRDKILSEIVFKSTLDGASSRVCPKNIDIDTAIRNAREALVLQGKGLKENEEMVKRVMKFGSPYLMGKKPIREHEKLDTVYS